MSGVLRRRHPPLPCLHTPRSNVIRPLPYPRPAALITILQKDRALEKKAQPPSPEARAHAPSPKLGGAGREVEVALHGDEVVAVAGPHPLRVIQDQHPLLPPQHHVQVFDPVLRAVALQGMDTQAGWMGGGEHVAQSAAQPSKSRSLTPYWEVSTCKRRGLRFLWPGGVGVAVVGCGGCSGRGCPPRPPQTPPASPALLSRAHSKPPCQHPPPSPCPSTHPPTHPPRRSRHRGRGGARGPGAAPSPQRTPCPPWCRCAGRRDPGRPPGTPSPRAAAWSTCACGAGGRAPAAPRGAAPPAAPAARARLQPGRETKVSTALSLFIALSIIVALWFYLNTTWAVWCCGCG